MDAETHQASDNLVAVATITATTSAAEATAVAETIQQENVGPLTAPKRQRRPSVRLGDIGDPPAATPNDSHLRRTKQQQNQPSWRTQRDLPTSKSVKARSITNLVNGNRTDYHSQDPPDERINQNDIGGVGLDFGYRKVKAKRGTTKRVRSNWMTSSKPDEGSNSRDDGDEGFRNFDPDYESPVHSAENEPLEVWNGQRRPGSYPGPGRGRVSSSRDNNELDYNQRGLDSRCTNEGVLSWLIELGLSRYAPVFEIHEVDDEILPMLTLEDLKDMGISAVGSRRKLYSAIQKLRRGLS